jgi:phosphoserine phosphatase
MSKIQVISVKKEKEIGVKLFCPKTIQEFRKLCSQFSETLKLNEIYYNELIPLKNANNKIVIASASFQYYLENLFPGIDIIGTLLEINSIGEITGISQHPFKEEKATLLQSKKFSGIKCLYTDSKDDLPTTKLSEKQFG